MRNKIYLTIRNFKVDHPVPPGPKILFRLLLRREGGGGQIFGESCRVKFCDEHNILVFTYA